MTVPVRWKCRSRGSDVGINPERAGTGALEQYLRIYECEDDDIPYPFIGDQ